MTDEEVDLGKLRTLLEAVVGWARSHDITMHTVQQMVLDIDKEIAAEARAERRERTP